MVMIYWVTNLSATGDAPWNGSSTMRISAVGGSCSQERDEERRNIIRKLLAEEEAKEIPASPHQRNDSKPIGNK